MFFMLFGPDVLPPHLPIHHHWVPEVQKNHQGPTTSENRHTDGVECYEMTHKKNKLLKF